MQNNSEIKLVQSPIIVHALQAVGAEVTERLNALNVDGQIATVDTVKALKDLRAQLNKELENFESQRKFIKEGVLNPYNEFEAIYKAEISEKYKAAIDKLKDKIANVETKIKAEKEQNVRAYFAELCAAEQIDFIAFESLGLEINLSTSEKAYKEKCNEAVVKTKDDLALIETHEHRNEVLVEYKKTLNVSKAITEVVARKKAEADEKERQRVMEFNSRKRMVTALGMEYVDFTNAYEYSQDIYISCTEMENMTAEQFRKRYMELDEAIKTAQAAAHTIPEVGEGTIAAAYGHAPAAAPAPIQAPKVEAPVEMVSASFTVTGTMAQLRALGQYMKDNKITYKNI